MKKIFTNSKLLFCISIACILSINLFAQGFSHSTQVRLQKVIDSFENSSSTPFVGGISVAIKVDGLAVWKGATGYVSRNVDAQNNLLPGGTTFTTDTLSRIYSVTKTFTAALVLELSNEGKFSLSDPITKYLPLLSTYNPGINSNVTIHQLLAHESGYSDYTDEDQLQIAVASDPTHIWTPYEMVSYVHQIAQPGAERKYSSTNYVLLGAIIEAATGKPVEQFYRKRFFNKLNLSSLFLDGRESIGSRGSLASPHDNISVFNQIFQLTGQPTFPDAYTNISRFPMTGIVSLAFTGGGIVSNASDLAEWGNSLFGGRATSKRTLDTMLNSISSTPDEDGDYLGYGIFVTKRLSATDYFIGHDGRAPGYPAIMFYQPDRKMTIAVLTNFYGANPYAIGKALYDALPAFLCGNSNRKEDKIQLCLYGKTICVNRCEAPFLIKAGAYLGSCDGCTTKNESNAVANVNNTSPLFLNAFPNPFAGNITFSFKVPYQTSVHVGIYDPNGRLLASLFNATMEKNSPETVSYNAAKLSNGVYICRLQTDREVVQQKIILRK